MSETTFETTLRVMALREQEPVLATQGLVPDHIVPLIATRIATTSPRGPLPRSVIRDAFESFWTEYRLVPPRPVSHAVWQRLIREATLRHRVIEYLRDHDLVTPGLWTKAHKGYTVYEGIVQERRYSQRLSAEDTQRVIMVRDPADGTMRLGVRPLP